MLSSYLNLDLKDVVAGFILAVTGAVLMWLLELLVAFKSGTTFGRHELALIGAAWGIAGITYLLKRLFSNNSGQLFTKDVTNSTLPNIPAK